AIISFAATMPHIEFLYIILLRIVPIHPPIAGASQPAVCPATTLRHSNVLNKKSFTRPFSSHFSFPSKSLHYFPGTPSLKTPHFSGSFSEPFLNRPVALLAGHARKIAYFLSQFFLRRRRDDVNDPVAVGFERTQESRQH